MRCCLLSRRRREWAKLPFFGRAGLQYAPMESSCFHCGLPIPEGLDLPIHYHNEVHHACCVGCQMVAQSIIDAGLDAYYRERTARAPQAALPPPELLAQLRLYDLPEVQEDFVQAAPNERMEAQLILFNITCAACVWLIEQQLLRLPGVEVVEINYSTERARVVWNNARVKLSDILLKIQTTGYEACPYEPGRYEEKIQAERKTALLRLWVAGLSMMQVMMYAVPTYLFGDIEPQYLLLLHWASMILTLPVLLYSAVPFYQGALRDWRNRRAGMDTPVALAIVLAGVASLAALLTRQIHGVYFDSISMFVFLLLGGRYLEQMVRRKTTDATERLAKLVPAFCHRVDGYPEARQVNEAVVSQLQHGDYVMVKAGEVIPVDGTVVEGCSEVDEAMLTGESLPLAKMPGQQVTAGTLNTANALIIQTDSVGRDTRLGNIVRLLDQAMAQKPRLAQLADRYASWFVGVLLLLAALVFAYWTLHQNAQTALWITVSLLVITCPCALSLATPSALAAASGRLATRQVLSKSSAALETLARVTDVVFDKTGTLTYGHIQVAKVQPWGNLDENTALAIAAALESYSGHPIAHAICTAARERGVVVPAAADIDTHIGQGISGSVNGTRWRIGSAAFVGLITWQPEATGTLGGRIWLDDDAGNGAVFMLQDHLRDSAAAAIAALQAQGLRTHILSGDQSSVVATVADQLAIVYRRAESSPEDKLAYVSHLQQEGKVVLMVGDGINDAPVLARADVSVAVAGGADVAQAGSDFILLQPDLRLITRARTVAVKTLRIIRENLLWALLYNLIVVPVAALGYATPWLAALGMATSSFLVMLNALRLLRA